MSLRSLLVFCLLRPYAGQKPSVDIALQNIIDTGSYMTSHTAVSLGVALPDHTSSLATGYKNRELSKELLPHDRMALGSGTKMFTATAVLKLIEKGDVHLEDAALPHMDLLVQKVTSKSLVHYLGPDIRNVTVRHLLHMTSGVQDFDSKVLRERGLEEADVESQMDLDKILVAIEEAHQERQELKQDAINERFTCKPGTCGEYSSTNYLLLGMLLAQSNGLDHWQDYDQSSFLPAEIRKKATRTVFPIRGLYSDFTDVHGYGTHKNKKVDFFHSSCSLFAVANTMTTGTDAAVLLRSIMGKNQTVLKPESMKEMLKLRWLETGLGNKVSAGQFYGMGMRDISANAIANPLKMIANPEVFTSGILLGHDGMTTGFNAFTAYVPRHDSAFSFIVNDEGLVKYFNFIVRKIFDLVCVSAPPIDDPLQATYENRDAFLNQKIYRVIGQMREKIQR